MISRLKKVMLLLLGATILVNVFIEMAPTQGFGESSKEKVEVEKVTDSTFKTQVLESKIPVLVDFFAVWCGPCRLYSHVIDQVAQDYKGKLKVVQVDVDKNPQLANAIQVEEIPTTYLIKNGKPYQRWEGFLSKEDVENQVAQMLRTTAGTTTKKSKKTSS